LSSEEIQGLVLEIVMAQKRIAVLLGKIEKLDGEVKTGIDLSAASSFVNHPIEIPAAWAFLTVAEVQKRCEQRKAYEKALIIANQLSPGCQTCGAKTHVDTESGTNQDRPGAFGIDGQWYFTCPKSHGVFVSTVMETETKVGEGG
jgi:hypothetical protein